ncbi:hypothetical protein P7C73_g1112, partial [Tremellales sp. Uapishka_1]
MYDTEYEEEVRKHAVMSEVLPDKAMWEKWEKTEAPLRQGRGWYPALDRHFLELLVISEIHCLSHPLHGLNSQPGQAERVHRHASRVRRVACDRIGAERLHAYRDRVTEAFQAYVHGGQGDWIGAAPRTPGEDEVQEDEDEEERGRVAERRAEDHLARSERPEKSASDEDDQPGLGSLSRARSRAPIIEGGHDGGDGMMIDLEAEETRIEEDLQMLRTNKENSIMERVMQGDNELDGHRDSMEVDLVDDDGRAVVGPLQGERAMVQA